MTPSDWHMLQVDSLWLAHPADWTRDVQTTEDGVSVYLESDGVSFGVVGIYPKEMDPENIVDQVSDSVRTEHPGLELEPMENDDDLFPDGVALEGLFMTLDTVAYCWIRSWRFADRCVLVYLQSIQPESGECEQVFHDLCESVRQPKAAQGEAARSSRHGLAEPGSTVE